MKYYAGIDLGGTFIKCGIVSQDGALIIKDKIPTGSERPYGAIAKDMANLALSLADKAGVKLTAAGIGSPGTVDSANGVIVYSNNIKWENVPLGKAVSEILNLPVFITNDANAAALGESYAGAGKDFKNIVFMTLGTGVGGGIVLDGKLYEGGRSAGAEIGHMLVRKNGEKCTCGRRGCLEAYASASALIKQTRTAMAKNNNSVMWSICGGVAENADGKTAFDGMRANDAAAKKVVNNYIGYLAEGITDVCNIFRPDAVILGGGICAEGETLLKPLKRKVARSVFGGLKYAPVKILTATLGNDAGVYGSARFAMNKQKV
ncbi:MAG: ROK family protein [Clostridia bacterium]|nr:ROK family protein [Clostridia bacterium]